MEFLPFSGYLFFFWALLDRLAFLDGGTHFSILVQPLGHLHPSCYPCRMENRDAITQPLEGPCGLIGTGSDPII